MRAAIDTKVQDRVRPLSKVSQGLLKRHFTVHPTFVAFCSNLFLMRLICTANIPPFTCLNKLLTHCGSNAVISVDIIVVNSFHIPSPPNQVSFSIPGPDWLISGEIHFQLSWGTWLADIKPRS